MEFLQEELDEILNIFSQEGAETLQSMDKNLLLLEKKPNNLDVAMHLFREAHSLKGSARMLGFMGIQNIAHKIEDVLGLVRESKLKVTSEITDTISAALSLIDTLIKKTIEQKAEYISDETNIHIAKLEAICNSVCPKEDKNSTNNTAPKQKEQKENKIKDNTQIEINKNEKNNVQPQNKEIFELHYKEFESCIITIISDYLKYIPNGDFDKIQDIKSALNQLVALCEKSKADALIEKAQAALDIANNCTKDNMEIKLLNLNSKITEFVLVFYKVMNALGIKTKNYYEEAHKITPEQIKDIKEPQKKSNEGGLKNVELIELINKVNETIGEINKNRHSLAEVKSLLKEIVSRLAEGSFKNIYKTVLSIIINFEKTGQKLEEDAIDALKELFESSTGIIESVTDLKNYNEFDEEIEILNQKATIVEQMIKYELLNPPKNSIDRGTAKTDAWAQSFDSTPIKTLRVNSDKLDKLVNQIGNLIVARIKSHEHIGAVKGIQDELLDWQKHYHKIGYYMKFYEKKYIQENIAHNPEISQKKDSFLSYNRQLIGFHNTNTEKINCILYHLNSLMKNLQENNIKLNTTTSDIENMVKSMRVLPLSTVFQLFPRMVHNIAKDRGKEIELIIEGQEISADKKIIEDVKIPIMHIIRNSIDHGIEAPKERERIGKDRTGTIVINASRKESKIVISIKDDGRGINIEKIRKKAIEKGLLSPEEALITSKEKLANFIFYPGFSTGDTVTELSGRGLGLDIVHTKISQLNGRIDVYSEENKGTIVTMELPTTMATLKTFIIMENNQLFAIPTSTIQTVLKISPSELKLRDDKYYFIYNDKAIPIYSLASILGTKDEDTVKNKYTIMVIKSENMITGLIVQKLIGDEEILHKKLPEPMLRVKNISGITTLANGEMCLLLNVSDILSSGRDDLKEVNLTKSLTYQDNSNYKILIVDDSITTRRLLSNILNSAGYKTDVTNNPAEALRQIDINSYDLIITDYEMPELNGYEFVRELRKKEKAKKLPVIIFTSVSQEGLADKFEGLNINQYLKKENFSQQMFLNTVSKALGVY